MKTTVARPTLFCLSLIVISLMLAFQSFAKVEIKNAAAIWLFDEGKGDVAKDLTGQGHDGQLKDGPKWADGKYGKALSFDGAKSYVEIPSTDSFALQDFTVSFFVNPGAQDEAIVTLIDYTHHGTDGRWTVQSEHAMDTKMWYLAYLGSAGAWQYNNAGYAPFTEGIWQHIAFVKTDVKVLTYKDGVLVNTRTNTDPKVKYATPAPLHFGHWSVGAGRFFNGALDEVVIFKGALSADDIKDIATRGLIVAAAVSPSGKLAIAWATIKVQY